MSEPMHTPPPPPAGGPPAGGPPYGPTSDSSLPWENRSQVGFMPALIDSVKLFVTSPREAYARAQEKGDFVSPLLYAVIIGTVAGIVGQIWGLLFQGSWMAMMPAEYQDMMGPMMAGGGASIILTIVFMPFYIAAFMFVWAGIVHLILMLLKAVDANVGFEGTFRGVAYSQTASLAQIVPLVGGLIAMVWTIFLSIIGIARMHKTTEGKAAAGVLIPIGLCCACIIIAFILGGAALMSAIGQAGG
ncbi:MAG: YIP1 family protein [Acidobacteriota bacterium]